MTDDARAGGTAIHDDLVEMLSVARVAENDLFGALTPADREAPNRIGAWSAKDVRTHLAAWRSIEVHRLAGEPDGTSPDDTDDTANARIQAERAGWTWERVATDADASFEALAAAIRATPLDELTRSEGLLDGISTTGVNHALGHLGEIAEMSGNGARYKAFLAQVEAIVGRGRLPQRDAGVLRYNLACFRALDGDLASARSLLRAALPARPDLAAFAKDDPDLAPLRDELAELSAG